MDPYAPLPRAVALAARTAHLLSMAGYLGTRLAGSSRGSTRWRRATTLTGALLLATEASHSRHWAYQGRGLLVFAHLGILPAGDRADRLRTPAAIGALVIGAVGSHLPRSIRKWSIVHRRVLDGGPARRSVRARDQVDVRRLEGRDDGRALDKVQLAD